MLALIGRLLLWKALPNGRTTTFFTIWAGRTRNPARHRAWLRADLESVFGQLAAGVITARIARRPPRRVRHRRRQGGRRPRRLLSRATSAQAGSRVVAGFSRKS
ncbi:hypothetical protein [Kutzneria sp. NPDC052558]|uniref:hypothetical protein n=1 Tax=Kutzneria sp. NPDC052558 TaxID=3364121 RepID=UPI0037C686EF